MLNYDVKCDFGSTIVHHSNTRHNLKLNFPTCALSPLDSRPFFFGGVLLELSSLLVFVSFLDEGIPRSAEAEISSSCCKASSILCEGFRMRFSGECSDDDETEEVLLKSDESEGAVETVLEEGGSGIVESDVPVVGSSLDERDDLLNTIVMAGRGILSGKRFVYVHTTTTDKVKMLLVLGRQLHVNWTGKEQSCGH